MIKYWNQNQIALHVGVSRDTIQRWKLNKQLPPHDAVIGNYQHAWLPATIKQWAKTL